MDPYQFTPTQDWFSHNIEYWSTLFPLVKSKRPRVLEIGSWEGRSAVFLLNNLAGDSGEIVCIDHFDLLQTEAGRQRFDKINHNLSQTKKKSRVLSQFSVAALMTLLQEEMVSTNPGFDWIYVDGSHRADDTMLDGELGWRLARNGAIVIFDDYHWDKEPEHSIHHPKRGIDAFLLLHAGEYERLSDDAHYQVVLRKTTDMRIGFLIGEGKTGELQEALEYGINVALAVDSAYAIGAAVTIRSTTDSTRGRITFYVVDCGLTQEDKEGLERACEGNSDATMVFLGLPSDSLADKLGASWAKLDMLKVLPVERVLYLDADTLIRRSLSELWTSDLGGKVLGAVTDIGHPMGHSEIERRSYFNAGVLLIDLSKARLAIDELEDLAKTMKNSKFRDQDALNVYFADAWMPLGLTWNAQGLGTYIETPSPLETMNDPNVVHFTGPVHPSVVEVLNSYIQPPTAKPWGYLGAPNHPYESEWWQALEKIGWKGGKFSEERQLVNAAALQKAVEAVVLDFEKVIKRRV
ncbi:glycosyltransferase family 8 protein [Hebeloma cylindrosporum]|uniref:Glycosyltransferase family 8 protein n=1 Tax=Hebeloma cylindrosporum TaxID=76867 RepID=A0A0C3C206_HEBCY|nr:glycosyltransferase family 8 protein [Hebeloma cylindrosporum h7]